jgi:hypothetical protein
MKPLLVDHFFAAKKQDGCHGGHFVFAKMLRKCSEGFQSIESLY